MTIHSFFTLRVILKIIGLTVVGGIAASILYFSTVNLNEYVPYLEKQLSEITNRPVKIKGDISFEIKNFNPVLDVNSVEVASAKWDAEKIFLSADHAFLSVDFFAFLTGKIELKDLYFRRIKIFLRKNKTGENNWTFAKNNPKEKEETKEEGKKSFSLSINSLKLKNLIIYDQREKKEVEYTIESCAFSMWESDNKMNLNLDLSYQGKNYHANFKTDSGFSLINIPKRIPLQGYLRTGETVLSLSGVLGAPLSSWATDLDFSVHTQSLKSVLKPFGIDFPTLPKIHLAGKMFFTSDFLALTDTKLSVGSSEADITAKLMLSHTRPSVEANIKLNKFDIPNLFPGSGKKAKSKTPQYVLEKRDPKAFIGVKFPLQIFKTFDAHVKLDIGEIKAMSTMPIRNIRGEVVLNNGSLTISDLKAIYADGPVKVNAQGDIRNSLLYAEGSLEAENISVGKIVQMSGGGLLFNPKTSLANVEIYLKGKGKTLTQLMKSLNGTGKVYTQKETRGYGIASYFLGQDILSSFVDEFKESGKDLDIQCVTGHLKIRNGVAKSEKSIALESDKINMVVQGHVDLGNEYMKVSLISKPVSGLRLGTSDFLSLVKIQGALA
ncbi:MAG: AsmA family protein, partial [Alphaproteobacteria bacterium]|nr:AsmA family protein [Alphaproteobacteria bacterium]